MDNLLLQIAKLEFITPKELKANVKKFQSIVKKSFKYYKTTEGLEDYKMELDDYIILLCLHVNTEKMENKLNLLLLSMYSIYKLDDFHFPSSKFNTNGFLHFICENKEIHILIHKLITDYNYIHNIKNNLGN